MLISLPKKMGNKFSISGGTNMNILIYCGIVVCLVAATLTGASQSSSNTNVVNFIIEYYIPPSANDEMINDATSNMMQLNDQYSMRDINVTVILTGEVSAIARGFATQIGLNKNVELAMSGNHSDESLSRESYAKQKTILENSKELAELCNICDVNVINVSGFMPQSFDQNEDTFRALDDLGIDWDAGFKSRIIFAPGHEKDVWPYKVENHNFYAVPVSTYTLSGEKVALVDREIKEKGFSSDEWYELLVDKFDEISDKNEPMVVSMTSSVSGSGDYLVAFTKFLDYAKSKGATFVTTRDLVKMVLEGTDQAKSLSTSACPTCDAAKSSGLTISGEISGKLSENSTKN
jgi:hypothetical protein